MNGAIGSNNSLTISNTSFTSCNGMYGGGIYVLLNSSTNNTLNISSVAFDSCLATEYGGGVYIDGRRYITNSSLLFSNISFTNVTIIRFSFTGGNAYLIESLIYSEGCLSLSAVYISQLNLVTFPLIVIDTRQEYSFRITPYEYIDVENKTATTKCYFANISRQNLNGMGTVLDVEMSEGGYLTVSDAVFTNCTNLNIAPHSAIIHVNIPSPSSIQLLHFTNIELNSLNGSVFVYIEGSDIVNIFTPTCLTNTSSMNNSISFYETIPDSYSNASQSLEEFVIFDSSELLNQSISLLHLLFSPLDSFSTEEVINIYIGSNVDGKIFPAFPS